VLGCGRGGRCRRGAIGKGLLQARRELIQEEWPTVLMLEGEPPQPPFRDKSDMKQVNVRMNGGRGQ